MSAAIFLSTYSFRKLDSGLSKPTTKSFYCEDICKHHDFISQWKSLPKDDRDKSRALHLRKGKLETYTPLTTILGLQDVDLRLLDFWIIVSKKTMTMPTLINSFNLWIICCVHTNLWWCDEGYMPQSLLLLWLEGHNRFFNVLRMKRIRLSMIVKWLSVTQI